MTPAVLGARRAAPSLAAPRGGVEARDAGAPFPPAIDALVLAAIVAVGIWVCSPAAEPGLPASWDAASHLVRLQFLSDELVRQWRLEDLWFPSWYDGFPIFLFYPPLFYVLTLAAHALTFGAVSLATTYKATIVATYLALPISLYAGVRLLDLGRLVALVAAALVLGVSSPHGIGVEGLFMIGIVTHCAALVLLPIAVGTWHRAATRGGPWILLAALVAATIVQTAFIVSVYLAVETALYTLLGLVAGVVPGRALVRRTAAMGGLVVVATAWWVLPMALATDRLGPQTGFGPTRVGQFLQLTFDGRFLGSRWTMVLAAAGLVVCLRRRTFVHHLLVLSTVLATLLAFGVARTSVPTLDRVLVGILRNRSFGFVGLWSAVLAAVTIGAVTTVATSAGARWARATAVTVLVLLAPWLGADVGARLARVRPAIVAESAFAEEPGRRAVFAAFDWLRDHGARDSLVGFETRIAELGQTGFNDPFSLLVLRTGMRTLGGLNVEGTRSSDNVDVLGRLHDRPPAEVHDTLDRYGIGTVVVYVDDTDANLARDPSRFERVFRSDRVRVFRLRRRRASLRDWQVRPWGRDPFHLKVHTRAPKTEVALPVSFDPRLRVSVGGADLPIARTTDNLVMVVVPDAGAASVRVRWPRSGLVDMLTLAGVLVQVGLATALALAGVRRLRRTPCGRSGDDVDGGQDVGPADGRQSHAGSQALGTRSASRRDAHVTTPARARLA